MSANGRGDLGFIPNQRSVLLSRSFIGHPGNPSNKKAFSIPQRASSSVVAAATGAASSTAAASGTESSKAKVEVAPRLSSDAMVTKRTEWLEAQEKRLTGTLEEHQNGFRKAQTENADRFAQLYEHTQWIYGLTTTALMGFAVGDMATAVEAYATKAPDELIPEPDTWVLLQHPMQKATGKQDKGLLMKMRRVNPRTGQMSTAFAIIGTQTGDTLAMSIGKFAVAPV